MLQHRPKNKLVNEAVAEYVTRHALQTEDELQAILTRVKAYQKSGPDFASASPPSPTPKPLTAKTTFRWTAVRPPPSARSPKNCVNSWVGRFRGSAPLSEIEVLAVSYLSVTAAEVAAETVRFAATLARILTHLDTHVAPGATPTPNQLSAVIEACAWAHAEWVRIHPFANGHGRTLPHRLPRVAAKDDALWQDALDRFNAGKPDNATLRLLDSDRPN